MKKKLVLFLSSAQPSANPRLLKEILFLSQKEFICLVIWCPISPWADIFDQQLFRDYPNIQWIQAGYHNKSQLIGFYYARIRQLIWKFIFRFVGDIFDAAIKSQVLFSQELNKKAKAIKADLYIGHNLGALPAIVEAAKLHKAKSIFDFEDFHRGEHKIDSIHAKAVRKVEDKYIPHVNGITASSSLIAQSYERIYRKKNIITINNVFPRSFLVQEVTDLPLKPLKLFWFSQYIGKKRGLETILQAMSKFKGKEITLTLLGTLSNDMRNYFQKYIVDLHLNSDQIIFVEPLEESTIPVIASQHHIGICSEVADIQNRDLCLTNKLFMYLLSGNALLLSNTKAQQSFLTEYPDLGMSFEQESADSVYRALKFYIDHPEFLNQHRFNALQLGRNQLNWDIEQRIFLDIIHKIIKS